VEVLNRFNITKTDSNLRFLNFEGVDNGGVIGQEFGVSIPSEIGLDPRANLFLAYEMNGERLPLDHGYPIRLIAPGMAGFKSVKFLQKIILAEQEHPSVWEQRFYRFYSPKYYWDTIDYKSAPSLIHTNVQSAILEPNDMGSTKIDPDGAINVRGFAFSGGGNGIRRVDVSLDNGQNWVEAELDQENGEKRPSWTWVLWKVKLNSLLPAESWITVRIYFVGTTSSF